MRSKSHSILLRGLAIYRDEGVTCALTEGTFHMTSVRQTTPWGDETPVSVRFKAATGTSDVGLQEVLIRQIQDAMPTAELHPLDSASTGEAAVAALVEIRPQDVIEGMLAGQFVAAYFTSMDCLKRASDPGWLPQVRDMNLRQAGKLMSTGLQLLEAIERRRGKGPASVTVGNFLNVQPGGQAVVDMQAELSAGRVDVHKGSSTPALKHQPVEPLDSGGSDETVFKDERIKRAPVREDARAKRYDP
jgi:hypothetical protein